jgi:hypothetical protein
MASAVPLAAQSDDAVDELGTEVICDEEEIFSAVVRLMNTRVTTVAALGESSA